MRLDEIDQLCQERYLNLSHGLELTPDINLGKRGNENGIVYLASFIMMKDILSKHSIESRLTYKSKFWVIYDNCTKIRDGKKIYGLLNRGKDESDGSNIRSISHDNISSFTSIDKLLNFCPEGKGFASRQIYKYGKKHFFIYNNADAKFDYPMNPGNWSLWAYNGGSKVFWILMLPFLLINMLITLNKPVGNTSGKILCFIELYPNKDKFIWKSIWKWYRVNMERQYGKKWLKGLMEIYFLPNHPNVLLADLIEEMK